MYSVIMLLSRADWFELVCGVSLSLRFMPVLTQGRDWFELVCGAAGYSPEPERCLAAAQGGWKLAGHPLLHSLVQRR